MSEKPEVVGCGVAITEALLAAKAAIAVRRTSWNRDRDEPNLTIRGGGGAGGHDPRHDRRGTGAKEDDSQGRNACEDRSGAGGGAVGARLFGSFFST